MAISQLPQAPYRQDRRLFPTPLTTDVLFSEVRDCTRNAFPAYGTPHPNETKWPHHKLIFIKTVDIERDGIFEFFYAADRENQDLYNFASGYRNVIGNAGGREFRVVVREYITPRADFNPALPEFGYVMPDVPQDTFDGVSYVFFDKQQKKAEQPELDSLYVQETHTYVETAFLEYKLSYTTQAPDLVPDKFRSSLPRTTTEEIAEGLAVSPILAANELQASQDQINPNVKLVKSVVQPKPTTDVVLVGTRNYVESAKANTVETYSSGILTPDSGLLVSQSTVTPTGDGGSIRETINVNIWPELTSTEWDDFLNIQLITKEQFIDPAESDLAESNTSFKAVNEDRTLKTVRPVPYDALQRQIISFPSTLDVQLPDTLESIEVVWSSDSGSGSGGSDWDGEASGQSASLSGSESSTGSSSATIKPDVIISLKKTWGSDLPIMVHSFFAESDNGQFSASQLLSRLAEVTGYSVSNWPVYKPQTHNIILTGGKARVSVTSGWNQQAGFNLGAPVDTFNYARSTSSSSEIDVSLNVDSIQLPATIHGSIVISGDLKREVAVAASAYAAAPPPANPNNIIWQAISSSTRRGHFVKGSVSPSSFSPTSPAAIPTAGQYLMRSEISPYKWGWLRCTCYVLDASVLK